MNGSCSLGELLHVRDVGEQYLHAIVRIPFGSKFGPVLFERLLRHLVVGGGEMVEHLHGRDLCVAEGAVTETREESIFNGFQQLMFEGRDDGVVKSEAFHGGVMLAVGLRDLNGGCPDS